MDVVQWRGHPQSTHDITHAHCTCDAAIKTDLHVARRTCHVTARATCTGWVENAGSFWLWVRQIWLNEGTYPTAYLFASWAFTYTTDYIIPIPQVPIMLSYVYGAEKWHHLFGPVLTIFVSAKNRGIYLARTLWPFALPSTFLAETEYEYINSRQKLFKVIRMLYKVVNSIRVALHLSL